MACESNWSLVSPFEELLIDRWQKMVVYWGQLYSKLLDMRLIYIRGEVARSS